VARKSKVMTAREAVAGLVPEGCRELAVGGMHMHNNPMALVRELIRQGRKVRRLVTSPSACLNADLLIGAGLVEEVLTSYIGFEHLGLAPCFRRAVEGKAVKMLECDEPLLVYGLYAGAGGIPFIPYPRGLDLSDIPKVNPGYYRYTTDPYTGEKVMAAPPIKPEVALIHCQEADAYGNAVFRGSVFTDRQMAFAADRVILQVEKVVERVEPTAGTATLPGFLVAAVVEAPYGCHPTSSHGYYGYDEPHLREYLKQARDAEGLAAYLNKYVHEAGDHAGYLNRVGGPGWR